jgi:Tryptophan halogenase
MFFDLFMKNIVIVGNGTAGVICSTYFYTYWKNKAKITLIYDSSKSIIGVGESTTPSIFEYLKFIGVSSHELLKYTNTSLKLGIKFKNWNNDKKYFCHNFLEPNIQKNNFNDTYFLSSAYSILNNDYDNDLYLQNYFIENNSIPKDFPNDFQHALHIDANNFSKYILKKFEDKIEIIDVGVKEVFVKNENIDFILLNNDKKIQADLYIDATGFSKILFKKLNSKWISMEDYLPLNKAIPNPVEKNYDYIPTYTLAESTKNGWIWQVPLQNRYGTGYVYSSRFTSDEEAMQDFDKWLNKNHKTKLKNNKIISYESGFYDEQWVGNCIAIGLSSGFVEPLESTAIHTIIRQVFYICTYYSLEINNFSRKNYNRKIKNLYNTIFNFIRFHYFLNRKDSNFHSYMNETTPEWILELKEKVNDSFITHYDFFDNDDLFTAINYITLCYGLNIFKNKNSIKKYLSNNNFYDFGKQLHLQIKNIKKINKFNSIDHKKAIFNIKNF